MAYLFRGVIIPNGGLVDKIGLEYIVKNISEPIKASIIYISKTANFNDYKEVIRNFSLDENGLEFLYLEYSTWAGKVEHVKSVLGSKDGDTIIQQADDEKAHELFIEMMDKIGINKEAAVDFAPFSREIFERESIFEM